MDGRSSYLKRIELLLCSPVPVPARPMRAAARQKWLAGVILISRGSYPY